MKRKKKKTTFDDFLRLEPGDYIVVRFADGTMFRGFIPPRKYWPIKPNITARRKA